MKKDVVMPSLGEDAGDECTVSLWHADAGDSIEKDEPLVEMATDKATFDVPSPEAGTVVETLVDKDDVVKVGQKIAVIEVSK
jgi:2-oxoglutarate dehydrogenase E2 component (dihydrolipoamide succinyltransferase)